MSLVSVSPEEIVFPSVINQEAVFLLKVKNITSTPIAFKVKTTAPKNYLVKPSAGTIPGNGTSEIKITLNKQATEPTSNSDRFLVQAVKTEGGKELTKEEWAAVDKSAIQELRLHVVFSGAPAVGSPGSGSPASLRAVDASSVVASMAVQPLAKDAPPEQVREKYEELVSLSGQWDKDKKRMESELDQCRIQLRKSKSISSVSAGGFSALQLFVAMVLAVLLARLATIMGY